MKKLLLTIGLLGLLASCMDSAGRKGRPLIKDYSVTSDESSCYLVYDTWMSGGTITNYEHACETSCPTGTSIASSTAIEEAIAKQTTSTDKDNARAVISTVKALCVDDVEARPTGQVYITSDYCSCINGKPDTLGNCDTFCAARPTETQAKLYVNTTLGVDILNHPKLGNLYNWCKVQLNSVDGAPGCMLHVLGSNGDTQDLAVSLTSSSNSFTVNINNLTTEMAYTAALVETNSGATSKSFQIYRKNQDSTTDTTTPIGIMSASLYSCIKKSGYSNSSGTDNYTDQAVRVHYYFAANKSPPSLPAGDPYLICHDVQKYGANDSAEYERLELTPNAFNVWNETDIRFSDLNQNNKMDINDYIEERLKVEYNVDVSTTYPKGISLFGTFSWPNAPTITTSGSVNTTSSSSAPRVGYFMQPWVDKTTQRAFCPTEEHYTNGTDPIFKVLKYVVGVPTEAVYLAEREALRLQTISATGTVTWEAAPQDVLIMREAQLKKVWFYRENGKNIAADELTANQKTIMFYWPVKTGTDPLTRQSDQVIYTVKAPTDIGLSQTTTTNTGLSTVYNPPDKRFGCIPSAGSVSN